MIEIYWLEDQIDSVEYEIISLYKMYEDIDIKLFQTIGEFIDALRKKDDKSRIIFVIDLMLVGESRYCSLDGYEVKVQNDLVAGIELYQKTLEKFNNNVIFYTSRGKDKQLFKSIFQSSKYNDTIFFIEKAEKKVFFEKIKELIEKIVR